MIRCHHSPIIDLLVGANIGRFFLIDIYKTLGLDKRLNAVHFFPRHRSREKREAAFGPDWPIADGLLASDTVQQRKANERLVVSAGDPIGRFADAPNNLSAGPP